MGVSLTYKSIDPVPDATRKAIESEARKLNKQREWWSENIIFFKNPSEPKHLTGDTKLYLGLGDDFDDEYFDDDALDLDVPGSASETNDEAEFDDDQFMGLYEARFLIWTLAEWSRKYSVNWIVMLAGSELTRINNGVIENEGILGTDANSDEIENDDERAKLIHQKYANRK